MLYIMRHGKTEWNDKRKLQGQTDIELNEEGIRMALFARDEYKDVHFDICYSSPLKRALKTAEIVLEGRNVPIITDDRLKEMRFGSFEGTEGYDSEDNPINVLFKAPECYTGLIGGAESLDELYKRTGEFLDEIIYPNIKEGKDILIVGHGAMNASIVGRINNIPRKDFWSVGLVQCKLRKLL